MENKAATMQSMQDTETDHTIVRIVDKMMGEEEEGPEAERGGNNKLLREWCSARQVMDRMKGDDDKGNN